MKVKISHISPASAAKAGFVIHAFIALIILFTTLTLLTASPNAITTYRIGQTSGTFNPAGAAFISVLTGITAQLVLGTLGWAAAATLYNLSARLTGGIEITLKKTETPKQ